MLTSVRESYAKIVSEGIFSKNRLKLYFDVVTKKASTQRQICTVDLGNYQPVALRSSPIIDPNNTQMRPAEAKAIEIALSDILPMVSFKIKAFSTLSVHLFLIQLCPTDCTRGLLYSSLIWFKFQAPKWS